MEPWEIDDAERLYQSLKHGQPSAADLVDAANLIKKLVDNSTNDVDVGYWD